MMDIHSDTATYATDGGASAEKISADGKHFEGVDISDGNLVYDYEEEPEVHVRTWLTLASMALLNFVQAFALNGPPVVLSYIGTSLNGTQEQTWIPNALQLVEAVIAPLLSSVSDAFQARKYILVVTSLIAFVGAAIAPGSNDIYRLIAAQSLIGCGLASIPIAYSVPSEILPRKWRPMAQAIVNVAAACGSVSSPLIMGALTQGDIRNGWKNFYWIQMGLWGLTAVGIFIGYRPPKRHTQLDHLPLLQKLKQVDLPGFGLLTIGLTLLLVGLNLGGRPYAWTNARVLGTLIVGIAGLLAFGLYEWKGTKHGILNHELFRGGKSAGRTFAICLSLIFAESVLLVPILVFYPIMTVRLFETRPLLLTLRSEPLPIACLVSTLLWGYWSSWRRTIRSPLFAGFVLFTAGIVGLATIQPKSSASALVFIALAGIGFGSPLILIITGVQLSTPHHLIATATAVTTSTRAVAATIFTAIYAAALTTRTSDKIPSYVATAARQAGLPASSLGGFIGALTTNNRTALAQVPGVSPSIITAASVALKHAWADSLRVVYIIAAPFGVVACILCFFLGDLRKTMNYRVDAPVEKLLPKHHAKTLKSASHVTEEA